MEDTRKLIPMGIKHCGDNKWLISIDGGESYSVKGDIDSVKRALRKFKAKDGDGDKHCRSSKNGTYKSMISDEDTEVHNINVWKSKIPHSAEEFKKLMEKNTVKLTKNYLIEGRIVPKGTILTLKEEEIKFLPTDIWNKAKELKGDARFDYIKKEIGDMYTDDEINKFISKNLKESKKTKYAKNLKKDITNADDLIELLYDEFSDKIYNYSEEQVDKIVEWAINDDKVIAKWNKMETLDIDDKAFIKTEQEMWNHIDNNINKIA